MKSILIIAVVVAFVGLASGAKFLGQYHHLEQRSESKASGVCYIANEIICSQDCSNVLLCIKDNNAFSPLVVDTCVAGTFCNAKAGNCTPTLSTCTPTNPPAFQLGCTATGHFPDPYDCTVYHECVTIGTASTVSLCDAGWSYNAMSTDCDHRLGTANSCFPKGVIPACTKAGQSGAVPENTNIYYVCLHAGTGLKHELYKCAHGGHYLNGTCT